MLFGNSSSSKEELLAVAAAEAAGTAAWRAKRKVAAGERAQQKALSEAKRAANASRSESIGAAGRSPGLSWVRIKRFMMPM